MNRIASAVLGLGVLVYAPLAQATLIVSSTSDATGNTSYGTTFFSSVTASAGDYLVVAHANNKRDNGNNDISLTGVGSNSVTALHGGDAGSGGGAGAWLFYSPITTAGTFDLVLNTNSGTATVSHASTYWVVSPGALEAISVAGTSEDAASSVASLDLNFTFGSSVTDGLGFAAGATSDAFGATPAEWNQVANANDKRRTYHNVDVDGSSLVSTFPVDTTGNTTLAGVVLEAVAIPEPSSVLTLALAGVVTLSVRWHRRAC